MVGFGTDITARTTEEISVATPANMKDDSVPYLVTKNPAKIGAGKLRNWVNIPVMPIVEDCILSLATSMMVACVTLTRA